MLKYLYEQREVLQAIKGFDVSEELALIELEIAELEYSLLNKEN